MRSCLLVLGSSWLLGHILSVLLLLHVLNLISSSCSAAESDRDLFQECSFPLSWENLLEMFEFFVCSCLGWTGFSSMCLMLGPAKSDQNWFVWGKLNLTSVSDSLRFILRGAGAKPDLLTYILPSGRSQADLRPTCPPVWPSHLFCVCWRLSDCRLNP